MSPVYSEAEAVRMPSVPMKSGPIMSGASTVSPPVGICGLFLCYFDIKITPA